MKSARVVKKMQNNQKVIVLVVVVVLILVGVYFLLRKNGILNNVLGIKEGFENAESLNNLVDKVDPKENEVVLVLFYVDWCPHCVSAKPEFAKVVNKLNNKNINGKKVKVNACNCEGTNVEKQTAEDNNIQGFPTIKLISNSQTLDYNGERKADAMVDFVKSNC